MKPDSVILRYLVIVSGTDRVFFFAFIITLLLEISGDAPVLYPTNSEFLDKVILFGESVYTVPKL
jgi:hypothetical protein